MFGFGLEGGQIGFDEGGVLEALSRPVRTSVTETFEYGRKGSAWEGQVIKHKTVTKSISVADIIAIGLIAACVYLGKEIYDELADIKVGDPFALMALIAKIGKDLAEDGAPEAQNLWSNLWTVLDWTIRPEVPAGII